MSEPKPGDFQRRRIQGVPYSHWKTAEGGDLFLTDFGLPVAEQLHPDRWLAAPWFEKHRERLRGTSAIYRLRTKPAWGKSLDVVVRFNRLGEDVPVDVLSRESYGGAAFNSPFEEIANLMALRAKRVGPKRRRIPTKRPLAIYSPAQRLQPWQTGRSPLQVAAKQARTPEVRLDVLREYIVVYGWINGTDAQEAAAASGLSRPDRERFLQAMMAEVQGELAQAGFVVLDMKPAHIILRFNPAGEVLRRQDGRLVYALVDYELLQRTS